MKNIFVTALMLTILPFVSKADDDYFEDEDTRDFIEFNVHAGVGFSSVMENYGKGLPGLSDFLLSPGCMMRGGLDVRFNLSNSFGLATGLDFGINNSRYCMSLLSANTGSVSTMYVRNHYYDLSVPVYMSFRVNLGDMMKWNIDPGIYFSEGVGGDTKVSGYTSGENSLGQPIVVNAIYKTKYYQASQPLINEVSRYDWGLRMASGIMYNDRITVNAVFKLGMRNLAVNPGTLDIRYRNLSLEFQIGYTL